MRKYLAAILALMLLAVVLPGCSADLGQPRAGTNFRLLVSDEPIDDFYSVNVTVSQIGVLSADTDNWTTYDVNRTFDLTKLQGDNATEIWNGLLTSGNYTKVFIYVDNVTGILLSKDSTEENPLPGDNATVKLPSGKLQISKPFSVDNTTEGSIVNFIFDITVVKAGESGKYILKPQIGASGPDQPFNDVTPGTNPKGKVNSESENVGKPENPGDGYGQPEGVPPTAPRGPKH
jgi:hypothetical protein